jgi:hypothetical protein
MTLVRSDAVGSVHVAVAAWPGPEDALTRAVRGPFRATLWRLVNKAGWTDTFWKCRHRHPDLEAAFTCGNGRLAALREAEGAD